MFFKVLLVFFLACWVGCVVFSLCFLALFLLFWFGLVCSVARFFFLWLRYRDLLALSDRRWRREPQQPVDGGVISDDDDDYWDLHQQDSQASRIFELKRSEVTCGNVVVEKYCSNI